MKEKKYGFKFIQLFNSEKRAKSIFAMNDFNENSIKKRAKLFNFCRYNLQMEFQFSFSLKYSSVNI